MSERRADLGGLDVTIAICTRNRASSLARTVESLTRVAIPHGLAFELIVVNNGSSDGTDDVIESFRGKLPIRREFEAATGLSNARNCAVRAARGRYIIWTDDDVLVEPDFIMAYVDAFRRWPDAAVFGGKIIPVFDEPMPSWLRATWRMVADAYAYRDFGDEATPLTLEGGIPYGANYALRMIDQRAYLYDPALGPGAWIPGEETSVIKRMLNDGKKCYWVAGAKVSHCIPPERQSLAYLRTYYRNLGRARAHRDSNKPRADGPRLFGGPRWLALRMAQHRCRFELHRWMAPPQVWLGHLISYASDRGYFEYCRLTSDPRSAQARQMTLPATTDI